MSEGREFLEEYADGRAEVARLFKVSLAEVEPDEHAHHSVSGGYYSHGHAGGQVVHAHSVTAEFDEGSGQWMPTHTREAGTSVLPTVVDQRLVLAGRAAAIRREVEGHLRDLRELLADVDRIAPWRSGLHPRVALAGAEGFLRDAMGRLAQAEAELRQPEVEGFR